VCAFALLLRFINWGVGFTYGPLNEAIVVLATSGVFISLWRFSLALRTKFFRLAALIATFALTVLIVVFLVAMVVGIASDILRTKPNDMEEIATLSAASGSYHLYYIHNGLLVSDSAVLRHEWTVIPMIKAFKIVAMFDGDGVEATLSRVTPKLGRLIVKQPAYEGGGTHIFDVPL
jgi:hypothetical protein